MPPRLSGLAVTPRRPPLLLRLQLGHRRLSRREPRHGHAEGAAGDVREADPVAELHGFRVAPVLAADAELDARPRLRAPLDRYPHELADAGLVDRREGVLL